MTGATSNNAASDRVSDLHKDDGYSSRHPDQGRHCEGALGENHVWLQVNEFDRAALNAIDISSTRDRGPLRARRERPRRCAAEQPDQFPAFHCPVTPVLPIERIAYLHTGTRLLRCGISIWPLSAGGHFRRTDTPDQFVACPLYLRQLPKFVHCSDSTKSAISGREQPQQTTPFTRSPRRHWPGV